MKEGKTQLLLAEDDVNFGMMLKIFLEMNGYDVHLCENGNSAWKALETSNFSLGIFDIMMPIMDGYSLAEKVVQLHLEMPFLFLTAKGLKEDQIKGYRIGASDYLIKPFDPEILLLKIQVVLKSQESGLLSNQIFEIGRFLFDASKRELFLGDMTLKLSPKEAALLKLLCEKKGELLPHSEAMHRIWKNDDYFTKQSMNVFISKLRKYLKRDTSHKIEIENLHSTGFLLKIEKISI